MNWHPRYGSPQEKHEQSQLHQRWVESEKARAALAKAKADAASAKAKADLEKTKIVKKNHCQGQKEVGKKWNRGVPSGHSSSAFLQKLHDYWRNSE